MRKGSVGAVVNLEVRRGKSGIGLADTDSCKLLRERFGVGAWRTADEAVADIRREFPQISRIDVRMR